MTDGGTLEEWLRCYSMQITDEAKIALFAHLKKESRKGDKIAHEALIKCLRLFTEE